MYYVEAGFAAAGLLLIWGLWPHARTIRDEVRFARFKRDVRAIWATEICAEDGDIIAHTGEDCWWAAFSNGQSAREAVLGAEF
jgi:hypothetical protein